ncbi:MAG TPA: DUF433 domain-containing protein [Thermomicrobiales bacterium]|nr:DUF433 domain-containing protein [Thermomicrobiales bacterium]
MRLEDYFDFLAPDDIRIKGTRVGIETVLYDFIHRARTPEQIVASYPTLTLEQVYATILYYLHNRAAVGAYLSDWLEFGQRMRAEQANDPAAQDFLARMRQARAALEEQPARAAADERT